MKTIHTPERKDDRRLAEGGFQIFLGILFFVVIFGTSIVGSRIWLVVGLAPIYWTGLNAFRLYQEDSHLSNRVLTPLVYCLITMGFLVAIIAGFDMSRLWPIALILAGAATILISRR